MEELQDRACASPLKNKYLFVSSLCSSCCFRSSHREETPFDPDHQDKPRLIKASSSWLRSRAHELPEFKEKCRNLFYRIGKGRKHQQSTDFRYDPLSYALNFDEGLADDAQADEFYLRNFSSRLPPSPPVLTSSQTAVFSREITACS